MLQDQDEFVNDNQLIHPYLNCTINDAMLMVYSFYLRHNLTWAALEDLLHLVNTVLGVKSLPTTKHSFKQKFDLPIPTVHLYCIDCQKYLGKKDTFAEVDQVFCSTCNKMCTTKTKYNKNHFTTLPIEPQIVSAIEIAIEKNRFHWPRDSNDVMSDVCDGEIYGNIFQKMNGRKFVTLCASTDGVVVVKASRKKSLWPIQFIINEIDQKYRYKRENIICAAFAFGDTPDMGMFFKEFVQELNKINSAGGLAINVSGRVENVMVFLTHITTDSVAKCHVAKITQFNGHYGCPYCYHKGTIVAPAKNVKYCVEHNDVDRTHDESQEAMIEAISNDQIVRGYRGISPVLALDTLIDSVWIFSIDKMHSIDLGVVKKIFNIFLESKNKP